MSAHPQATEPHLYDPTEIEALHVAADGRVHSTKGARVKPGPAQKAPSKGWGKPWAEASNSKLALDELLREAQAGGGVGVKPSVLKRIVLDFDPDKERRDDPAYMARFLEAVKAVDKQHPPATRYRSWSNVLACQHFWYDWNGEDGGNSAFYLPVTLDDGSVVNLRGDIRCDEGYVAVPGWGLPRVLGMSDHGEHPPPHFIRCSPKELPPLEDDQRKQPDLTVEDGGKSRATPPAWNRKTKAQKLAYYVEQIRNAPPGQRHNTMLEAVMKGVRLIGSNIAEAAEWQPKFKAAHAAAGDDPASDSKKFDSAWAGAFKKTEAGKRAAVKERAKADMEKRAAAGIVTTEYPYSLSGFQHVLGLYGVELMLNIRHMALFVRSRPDTRAAKDAFPAAWTKLDDYSEQRLRLRVAEVVWYETGDADNSKKEPVFYEKGQWYSFANATVDTNRRDTFLDWMNDPAEVPEWDENKRVANYFYDLFRAEGEIAPWASVFIFAAPYYRALHPGAKLDETPVLFGKRKKTGKSTSIQCVFPPDRQQEWFTDSVNPLDRKKEVVDALEGRVLGELSEMDTTWGKKGVGRLKTFMTRLNDSIRASYGRRREERPRQIVFVASTNNEECLAYDPSGLDRRFVVFECPGKDTGHGPALGESFVGPVEDWMDEIVNEQGHTRRQQLWAEAKRLVDTGLHPALPNDLMHAAVQAAETHRVKDAQLEDKLESMTVVTADEDLPVGVKAKMYEGERAVAFSDAAEAVRLDGRWVQERDRDGEVVAVQWEPRETYRAADQTRMTNALRAREFRPLGRGTVNGRRESYWGYPPAVVASWDAEDAAPPASDDPPHWTKAPL